MFRASAEYQDPVRIEEKAAIALVRRVALHGFRLPVKEFGLDAASGGTLTFHPGVTNGLRRYVITWFMPSTEEEREWLRANRQPYEVSVHGEVDAVSGALKSFGFSPNVLDLPDPIDPANMRSSTTRFDLLE